MKKVAIVGGNGYLGTHICAHLLGRGVECDVFDIHDEPFMAKCRYRRLDVTDAGYAEKVDFAQYDAIYFLSGLTGPERSFEQAERFLAINESGLLTLCKKLATLGKDAPKIVFPSSRLVYKGGMRVKETDELEARSVYAATKIAGENLLSAYHYRYGIPYAVLRICVPYGNLTGGAYSYGTVGFFLKYLREKKPITLYGDGSNRKTYTFIADLCEIAEKVGARDVASGVYNVGGYDYSLREIAEILIDRFGGSMEYVPWPESALRVEMGDISLDSSKLDSAIRFRGYQRFEDVVQKYLILGE